MSKTSSTRLPEMKSCFTSSPRLPRQSVIIGPIKSVVEIIDARIYGSSIRSMSVGSGSPDGLCTSISLPFLSYTLYETLGTVVMTSISNSRPRRSCTISMWSSPRNPQRNPKPRATDDSGVNVREASLSCSFSSDVRRFSKSSVSIGYTPANTIGFTSWKPSMAFSHGLATWVIVSPTFTSRDVLMPLMIYPTLPALSSLHGDRLSLSTPISSALYCLPVFTNFTKSSLRMRPFRILKYAIMPRNGLKTESKINAWSGASGSPDGAGMRSTIASRISGTPMPVLPLARIMSSCLHPSRSTIWSSTSSGFALSRSTLLTTGMISKSLSIAIYRLEMVCAWMPCDASTISSAPSQAAIDRDTS